MKQQKLMKHFLPLLLIGTLLLGGCSQKQTPPAEKTAISIAALKGPTGIGMAPLMEQAEQGTSHNDYSVTIAASPDEVVAKIISKEVDIAMVPTNMAALLYQKTEGAISLAALNTLGTLYLVEKGDTIHSLADLSGKTITMAGQGAVPEYVLQYLLEKNQVTDVTFDFVAEHAEAATALSSGNTTLALLPEPNVTGLTLSDKTARVALDLNTVWNETVTDGTLLSMGCVVVQKEFLEANQEAFDAFLAEYETAIATTNENPKETAVLVEKFGILPKAAIAEKAIPTCHIVYMDGDKMEQAITPFYQILFDANPKSLGAKMPDEAFYYKK